MQSLIKLQCQERRKQHIKATDHVFFPIQAYKAALESLGHSEYALKAGFDLNPKAVEAALQVGLL